MSRVHEIVEQMRNLLDEFENEAKCLRSGEYSHFKETCLKQISGVIHSGPTPPGVDSLMDWADVIDPDLEDDDDEDFDDPDYNDFDEDDVDQEEQLRRDEKRGLYGGQVDQSN